MIPASVISKLVRLGLTDQQIDAVAALMDEVADAVEAKAGAVIAGRRAADRERKQKQRSIDSIMSREVTARHVTNRDIADSADTPAAEPLHSSSESVPPSPPKGALSPRGRRDRGGSLPADWQPKDRHFDRAANHGLNGSFIGGLAETMREWAGANSNRAIARKADWDLTFDGFIRRELEKRQSARAGPEKRHPVIQARDEIRDELFEEMQRGH